MGQWVSGALPRGPVRLSRSQGPGQPWNDRRSPPQILCIHLKRFRHEVMYSFKISSHVSFPLEGLDLRPFLAKECTSQITTYDLLSVICHHGTAGSESGHPHPTPPRPWPQPWGICDRPASPAAGGHYIAYCQNVINGQWYEFDDQYVTEVHETVVQSAEAYVLFYRCAPGQAGGGPASADLWAWTSCHPGLDSGCCGDAGVWKVLRPREKHFSF